MAGAKRPIKRDSLIQHFINGDHGTPATDASQTQSTHEPLFSQAGVENPSWSSRVIGAESTDRFMETDSLNSWIPVPLSAGHLKSLSRSLILWILPTTPTPIPTPDSDYYPGVF